MGQLLAGFLLSVFVIAASWIIWMSRRAKQPGNCDYCGRRAYMHYGYHGGWKSKADHCGRETCRKFAARDVGLEN